MLHITTNGSSSRWQHCRHRSYSGPPQVEKNLHDSVHVRWHCTSSCIMIFSPVPMLKYRMQCPRRHCMSSPGEFVDDLFSQPSDLRLGLVRSITQVTSHAGHNSCYIYTPDITTTDYAEKQILLLPEATTPGAIKDYNNSCLRLRLRTPPCQTSLESASTPSITSSSHDAGPLWGTSKLGNPVDDGIRAP